MLQAGQQGAAAFYLLLLPSLAPDDHLLLRYHHLQHTVTSLTITPLQPSQNLLNKS